MNTAIVIYLLIGALLSWIGHNAGKAAPQSDDIPEIIKLRKVQATATSVEYTVGILIGILLWLPIAIFKIVQS